MKITVNGIEHEVSEERLTYEHVAALAGPGKTQLTIVFHGRCVIDGERYEKNGILIPGESVKVLPGMQFVAVFTGSA